MNVNFIRAFIELRIRQQLIIRIDAHTDGRPRNQSAALPLPRIPPLCVTVSACAQTCDVDPLTLLVERQRRREAQHVHHQTILGSAAISSATPSAACPDASTIQSN